MSERLLKQLAAKCRELAIPMFDEQISESDIVINKNEEIEHACSANEETVLAPVMSEVVSSKQEKKLKWVNLC